MAAKKPNFAGPPLGREVRKLYDLYMRAKLKSCSLSKSLFAFAVTRAARCGSSAGQGQAWAIGSIQAGTALRCGGAQSARGMRNCHGAQITCPGPCLSRLGGRARNCFRETDHNQSCKCRISQK